MREFNRIRRIMNIITEIWEYNPDWRFGQLMSNIFGEILHNNNISDIFFPEDDFWERELKKYKAAHSIWNYKNEVNFKEV